MATPKRYERPAWEDRFNPPAPTALRAGLPAKAARLFDLTRRHMKALDGVTESPTWMGDCWRWTLEYRTKHAEEPLAVLVPSPADLQLAMPMDLDFVRQLESRRLKRSVRDGVGLAQEMFDTRWGIWSINSATMLEDLLDLIELKLNHLAKRVG